MIMVRHEADGQAGDEGSGSSTKTVTGSSPSGN